MDKNRLLHDLESSNAETAMEAAKAIIAKHVKVPVSAIEAIASNDSGRDWSRASAIYLLGNLRSKKSASILARILEDEKEKPLFREYAAEALGNIGDPTYLPIVSRIATETKSPEIRTSCQFAAEEIRAASERKNQSRLREY
jgi:HEAT repeat protein